MKITLNLRFWFSLAVALIGGYTLYASINWPFKTALFPRLIGAPLLILAAVETALSAFGTEKQREGHATDFQLTTDVAPAVARKRTLAIVGWTVGFFVLILAVGFLLAVPLFVFLYLRLAGKEGWILTLSLTAVSWLFMEGVFNRLLHLPFSQGWIWSLWN
jgi:hypothetical protein